MKKGCLLLILLYFIILLNIKFEPFKPAIKYYSTNSGMCTGIFDDGFTTYFQYKTGTEVVCGGCMPIGLLLFPVLPYSVEELREHEQEYKELKKVGLGYSAPAAIDSIDSFWKKNDLKTKFLRDNWKDFPVIRISGNLDTFGILRDKEFEIINSYHVSKKRINNALNHIRSVSDELPKMKPAKIAGQKIPVETHITAFWNDLIPN